MTASLDQFVTSEAKVRRDRFGRPLVVPVGGGKPRPYTRPTTLAETLDDRWNLERWKQRQVLLGTIARPDLHALAATTPADDKKALDDLVDKLMEAAASAKGANMGNAVHAAVEAVNRGGRAPDMFSADVAAYRAALEAAGAEVDPDHVEQFVVNDHIGAAGTFDMRLKVDGRWYVADLKTGSSIDWSANAFAVQLAVYADHTTIYDWSTDTHGDRLDVDRHRGVIVHLPAGSGTCALHWLDLDAGREALEHALWVRRWRNRRDLLTPFQSPQRNQQQRRPARIEPTVDTPAGPDEEGDADPAHYAALKAEGDKLKSRNPQALQLALRWRNEAKAPWRWNTNGDDGAATTRRVAVTRCALALAEFTVTTIGQLGDSDTALDTTARAALEEVLGDEVQTRPVGALLGLLTAKQADQLRALVTDRDGSNNNPKRKDQR